MNQIIPIQVAHLQGLQGEDIDVTDTIDQERFTQLKAWKNQNHGKTKLGMTTRANCKTTYAQTHDFKLQVTCTAIN